MGTGSGDATVVSLSGAQIFNHGEPAPFQPVFSEICLEQISSHITAHLGPVDFVLHELVSDTVHIDVHIVKPTADYPWYRLVTSGMSDLPMTIPDGADAPAHAELVITLPADWRLSQENFNDESWYWPVRLIKQLALLPHKHATWLGFGHTVPNGDPAEPYAPNTHLCGAILIPPLTAPEAFESLVIDDGKIIRFYAVVPIHSGEMKLKLRKGSQALFERFDAKGVTEVVDIARPDVTRKRFGLF